MTIDTRFRRYDLGTRYPGRCLTNLLTRINELTLHADFRTQVNAFSCKTRVGING